MSADTHVNDFLSGLLVTDRESLRFLYQAVLGTTGAMPPAERAASELSQHVQSHAGEVPVGLLAWLRTAGSVPPAALIPLIRLAGFYGDEAIAEPLLVLLRQLTFVAAHPVAVHALAQVKGRRAPKVLTDLLWSAPVQNWHVREPAILRELGRLGDPVAVDDLIRALGVGYQNPVRAAAQALASFPSETVFNPLLALLRKGESLAVAAGAAEALGALGDAGAISYLQRASTSGDAGLAISAAVALARLGSAEAAGRLLELSRHSSVAVRARAFGALALIGARRLDPAATSALQAGLADPQPEVRSAAAYALGRLGQSTAATWIETALRREVSPLVRTEMVRALGQLGAPRSLTILLELLAREEVGVRVEILDALSLFPDPDVARHIVPFRASADRRLVEAANRALRRLLYHPFGWPAPAAIGDETTLEIPLYSLEGARERLLPPPPPPPPPGFFGRVFGGPVPEPPAPPAPVGRVEITADAVLLDLPAGIHPAGWQAGLIHWTHPFSVTVTREPISEHATTTAGSSDAGIHFVLRQRVDGDGARFQTVAVSLWTAPSEEVGKLTPKAERLPCLDPHAAEPFLAAVQFYARIHGQRVG